MNRDDTGDDSESNRQSSRPLTRRRVLKATTAAAVGGAGLSAMTGTALADNCGSGWASAPSDYPIIDLRQDPAETSGAFPTGDDEFLIYVHGWEEADNGGGENQGYTLEQALEQNGYTEGTVTAMWESNVSWSQAKSNADEAGQRLAAWLEDYMSEYDTTVKIAGHSLGTRVTLEALNQLGGSQVIDDVALLGAAVDPDTVCEDGVYAPGITESAEFVNSYHSENDDVVCSTYAWSEGTSGLGCEGSECNCSWSGCDPSSIDNYADNDVTEQVGAHCDYMKPDVGCVPQVVANF